MRCDVMDAYELIDDIETQLEDAKESLQDEDDKDNRKALVADLKRVKKILDNWS